MLFYIFPVDSSAGIHRINVVKMEPNESFWKSSVKMVPGRPSPTKDFNRSTTVKAKSNNISNSSTNSFEKYQKSVSDAWTLSEDELTKEYCILSEDTKPPRRLNPRAHKNPIAVVHRHQNAASSSSGVTTNSATTSTANNVLETTVEEDEIECVKELPVKRKVSNEYG